MKIQQKDFIKDMSQLQDICEHNYKVYYDNKNKLQKTLVNKLNE